MTYSAIATSTPTNLTTIDTPAGAAVMAAGSVGSHRAAILRAECYSRHGLAHLAHEMHDRWGIDRQSTFTGFMTVFAAVSAEYSDPPIHTMSEVFCATLDRFITSYGHRATPDELIDLHDQFWLVAQRWVEPSARPELRELWGRTRSHCGASSNHLRMHLTSREDEPSSLTVMACRGSSVATARAKKPGDGMQTVVLVHGAWHAAWCWEKLTPELEGLGVLWSALDLPFTSLEDDAEALRERLDAIDGEKVVVGHSYGGSVISTACDGREDVAHLVYLAAFLFEPDENPIEMLASWGDNPLLKAMRFEDDGRTSIDPSGAGEAFYGCCEPGDASAAIKRLRPFGAAANELAGAAWKQLPTTYVVCERDGTVPVGAQRQMAQRADFVTSLDTDHSPFLSMPAETAAIIRSVVTG